MEIHLINTGFIEVDGGAMFGATSKSIWEKQYPANDKNLCKLAMHSLLIKMKNKNILIDTGAGNKLSEDLKNDYNLENSNELFFKNLEKQNIKPQDITDVILTHLHFDHCGGSTIKKDRNIVPTFENAIYHISKKQWENALNPNELEKYSFCEDDFLPLKKDGKLNLIEETEKPYYFCSEIEFHFYDGHTIGQIIPIIHSKKMIFAADLIPTFAHLNLYNISAYDLFPLKTFSEKKSLIEEAKEKNYTFIFQHESFSENNFAKV